MDQEQKTKEFFDNISDGYKKKYENETPFHNYFFNERLEKATNHLDFNHKHVLDIGSGTGNLYDYLINKYPDVEFYASDISEGMLNQSNVPADRKHVGNCYEIDYPIEKFDYIYMLGVTTYMTMDELKRSLNFIASKLNKDGMAILTFTNKNSYDYRLRNLLKKPLQLLFKKNGSVLMQNFAIYSYSIEEIKVILSGLFEIKEIAYLNHTIFPFNFLLPELSLARAKKIKESSKSVTFLEKNSSDYLVKISLK